MKFARKALAILSVAVTTAVSAAEGPALFHRVSTFNICEQIDPSCNTDEATNAETLWYFTTESGGTSLVYTDSERGSLGFVDITDPSKPKADGVVPLGGEPTTVRVIGDYGACHSENPPGKGIIIFASFWVDLLQKRASQLAFFVLTIVVLVVIFWCFGLFCFIPASSRRGR
jgi:hypothetical protein